MHTKTRMHIGVKTAELKCVATHNTRKQKKKKEKRKKKKNAGWCSKLKKSRLSDSYSPLKNEVNKSPTCCPPLSDMDPTLTYCGVEDLVTTTLPR